MILTQIKSADVFRSALSHYGQVLYSNHFLLFHLSMFCEVVSLARLVKAEIVYPLYGILINTDVGNPIVPVSTFPQLKASPKRLRGGLLVFDLL